MNGGKRIGRPLIPKELHKASLLSIRLSAAERKQLRQAAGGERLSAWARRILLGLAPPLPPAPPAKVVPKKALLRTDGLSQPVAAMLRMTPNDAPLKTEKRVRVHDGCALPDERVLGRYGPSPAVVCPRCRQPAPEGRIVVAGKDAS